MERQRTEVRVDTFFAEQVPFVARYGFSGLLKAKRAGIVGTHGLLPKSLLHSGKPALIVNTKHELNIMVIFPLVR